jgi:hypothetical protein
MMEFYSASFFIREKIGAHVGVNALKIHTHDRPLDPSIVLYYPEGEREKYARIAAAINEIMAEDDGVDAPLVEAIASDTFTPLGEAAATVVAGLTPEADGVETLASAAE